MGIQPRSRLGPESRQSPHDILHRGFNFMKGQRAVIVPAVLESLSAIRELIEGVCDELGVSERERFALALAADEACTNVIVHGYRRRRPGDLQVEVGGGADEIRVVITDRGRPFDPSDAPPPDLDAGWRERRIGGLGQHLIRQMVDRVEYSSDPRDGNVLTLVKRLERSSSGVDRGNRDGHQG